MLVAGQFVLRFIIPIWGFFAVSPSAPVSWPSSPTSTSSARCSAGSSAWSSRWSSRSWPTSTTTWRSSSPWARRASPDRLGPRRRAGDLLELGGRPRRPGRPALVVGIGCRHRRHADGRARHRRRHRRRRQRDRGLMLLVGDLNTARLHAGPSPTRSPTARGGPALLALAVIGIVIGRANWPLRQSVRGGLVRRADPRPPDHPPLGLGDRLRAAGSGSSTGRWSRRSAGSACARPVRVSNVPKPGSVTFSPEAKEEVIRTAFRALGLGGARSAASGHRVPKPVLFMCAPLWRWSVDDPSPGTRPVRTWFRRPVRTGPAAGRMAG